MGRAGAVLVLVVVAAASCAREDPMGDAAAGIRAGAVEPSTSVAADRFSGPSSTALSPPTLPPPSPVPISPSLGCGTPHRPEDAPDGIEVGGRNRRFTIHRPTGYDGNRPMPLVVDFHGVGDLATTHAALDGLGPYGDSAGFITVSPQALGEPTIWNVTRVPLAPDDVAFVAGLLDAVQASDCIDTSRIYAVGFSFGGLMAAVVACGLPGRFAAVAAVSGVMVPTGCPAPDKTPLIAIHGTADDVLPYGGGIDADAEATVRTPEGLAVVKNLDFPPVREVVGSAAARNGCAPDADERRLAPDVTALTWRGCAANGMVELITVDGGGHTWPGSRAFARIAGFGHTTMSIDANQLIWGFLRAHPAIA